MYSTAHCEAFYLCLEYTMQSRVNTYTKVALAACCLFSTSFSALASDVDVSGYIGVQGRFFTQDPLTPSQKDTQLSINAEPEFYWAGDSDSFTFKPYIRLDSVDDERTHFDIREAMYIHVADEYELHVGIGKVFWGVTETLHLVDIVNQTDEVESFDQEEKLGQPMAKFSTEQDWGALDLIILPYFRERTFAGENGRLRFPVLIDTNNPIYESSAEESHIDFAARWSNTIGDWDIGLTAFDGTSREALFKPVVNEEGEQVIRPFYAQITQFGVDAQYIYEDWLFKLEAIHRSGKQIDDFFAAVGGFEYTLYGVFDSATDVGIVVEYAFDERDTFSPNQNDLSVAARIALNDAESTEILTGIRQDLEFSDSRALFIEAATRIGESTRVTLDAWVLSSDDTKDITYNFRRDDFIQLTLEYYF